MVIRLILRLGVEIYLTIRDYGKIKKLDVDKRSSSIFISMLVLVFLLLYIQTIFFKFVVRGREYLKERANDQRVHNLNLE